MIFVALALQLTFLTTPVSLPENFHAAATQKRTLPWSGHFAAKNFTKNTDKTALQNIKKNLQKVVIALPKDHTSALQSLEVRNTEHVSRGLANSKKIILNTGNIDSNQELQSVFIHELGHVVDLGHLKGKLGHHTEFKDGQREILSDDISLKFYRLSWQDAHTRKAHTTKYDFISGYAMSDAFEDFAETYLFYRLHGAKFRAATTKSSIMGKKYAFMRDYVFKGKEFQTDQYVNDYTTGLIWDATLLNGGSL